MPLSQPEPSGSSLLLLSRCCSIPRVEVNHSTTPNFQFIHYGRSRLFFSLTSPLVRIRSAASGKMPRLPFSLSPPPATISSPSFYLPPLLALWRHFSRSGYLPPFFFPPLQSFCGSVWLLSITKTRRQILILLHKRPLSLSSTNPPHATVPQQTFRPKSYNGGLCKMFHVIWNLWVIFRLEQNSNLTIEGQ